MWDSLLLSSTSLVICHDIPFHSNNLELCTDSGLCSVLLLFVLGLIGFWGFGLSLQAKTPKTVPVFFFGLSDFAGGIVVLVSDAYFLDCYRACSQDAFAAVTLVRAVFSFVMTFFISDWIARDGITNVFFVIGILHGLCCILGMAPYVYSK